MTDLFRIPFNLIRPLYERTSIHRSVVEEVENEQLQEAYARCREMTRHHAKTFYMATRFLPNKKQRGIFAIYALCRYVDDLVDEAEDLIIREKITYPDIQYKIESWKQKLQDTYQGKRFDDPILLAFSDVLRNYEIPIELPFELMEGVCMDLYKNRYETFDELWDYSYKVASTVGLMTSEVFGYSSEKALQHAIDLGIAMQLTNILRDVGEDLKKNRIYLPKEELEQFGITEEALFDHRIDDSFIAFMQFQIERARKYYRSTDNGIEMLEKDSRLPVYLASFNYGRILDKIEENGYNVFEKRAYLNATEKISILPRVFYRMKYFTS
ncbi:squalene/phytoene synthase family protein [Aliifodinibius sp. S!AR15-10]|uniref:phytoene/squalene synthase family protein n=1 Tax=Aliifodinibius sp. S!AR15-10 TaxID=2950437 RepID=UPI00285B1169|nr:squalene/phytoene synthase family protein [Aliifodinibius sp. S!AR15-10]MDR8391832.1 squalene/phytoene synthase family protein [Aliifodinibius sp. S!AR15-10]